MDSTLIAAINTTDYFLGFLGLGITHTDFGDRITPSPLSQAVESYGLIPSYTYGYTAGAHYRNVPASLTLGGYDASRFMDHGNRFVLGTDDNFPWTLVRGIQANITSSSDIANNWNSTINVLSDYNDSFTALIDSTTPFLWLPDSICDKFASALNLTYNTTLDLYTLTNDQYRQYGAADALDFVFSLSSRDNQDNFGDPLNVPGVVNITIPSRALVSTVQYPFMDEAIVYGDPAVPYFSLRRHSGDDSTFIIGRSFLQESYLLTQYDESIFSIHQAQFPEQPDTDIDIIAVEHPSNSPYPPPKEASSRSLSAGELGGIVAGVVIAALLIAATLWMWCRRRKARQQDAPISDGDLEKTSTSSSSSPSPGIQEESSPIARFVNRFAKGGIFRRRKSLPIKKDDPPSEVQNNEIFELSAPIPPAELDGDNDDLDSEGDFTYDVRQMSTYEKTRLRMDRQLAGPVPAYSPPTSDEMLSPEKNTEETVSPSTDYPQSVLIAPMADSLRSNSFGHPEPSPISSRVGSSMLFGDEPSPITTTNPSIPRSAASGRQYARTMSWGRSFEPTSTIQTRSDSSASPITPSRIAFPPSVRLQRTPIDPSNVVCLGPLPEQPQQSSRPPTPEVLHADGRTVNSTSLYPSTDLDHDSFNSSFTEDEAEAEGEEEETRRQLRRNEEERRAIFAALRDVRRRAAIDTGESTTLDSQRRWSLQTEHYERPHSSQGGSSSFRRNNGGNEAELPMELVHVPQLPERRYSWEEE